MSRDEQTIFKRACDEKPISSLTLFPKSAKRHHCTGKQQFEGLGCRKQVEDRMSEFKHTSEMGVRWESVHSPTIPCFALRHDRRVDRVYLDGNDAVLR